MKQVLLFALLLPLTGLVAQTPNQKLQRAFKQFSSVKSFKSDVYIKFNLPSVNIEDMSGKAFYKAPVKFRVRLKGIAFLPKDNPFRVFELIRDSSQYASVANGVEKIGSEQCQVISVIPNADSDLVFAKIWLGEKSNCPLKMQLTSRSNGVVVVENTYGRYATKSLPDKMRFTVDMNKFKVPKALTADINSAPKKSSGSNQKSTGTIEFVFSNYALNATIDDKVFVE
ncbi:MAG: hypothetical protein R2792_01805 [Saprospiraceae bacterium]